MCSPLLDQGHTGSRQADGGLSRDTELEGQAFRGMAGGCGEGWNGERCYGLFIGSFHDLTRSKSSK